MASLLESLVPKKVLSSMGSCQNQCICKAWTLKIPIPPSCWSHSPNFFPSFHFAVQNYELTKVDSFLQNEWNIFHEYLHYDSVYHKLAAAKSIANDWTRAFAVCLHGDWTLCCSSCWPSTPLEGAQGGVRHSVLQRIWWDRSSQFLDSWIFSGIDCVITILASPHI